MKKATAKGKANFHAQPAGTRFSATRAAWRATGTVPGFVEPCSPTLTLVVPTGERWLYEIRHDVYRVQAHLKEGKPALLTSSGLNWSGRLYASLKPLGFALTSR